MTDNVKAAEAAPRVPKRVAAVIINSLKGGVVPRIGLPYITVGREAEIRALLTDLSLIADGGASFRFLVGRYGSGKSFLLQTIRTHAMGEGFVVADADLRPNDGSRAAKAKVLPPIASSCATSPLRPVPRAARSCSFSTDGSRTCRCRSQVNWARVPLPPAVPQPPAALRYPAAPLPPAALRYPTAPRPPAVPQ